MDEISRARLENALVDLLQVNRSLGWFAVGLPKVEFDKMADLNVKILEIADVIREEYEDNQNG